MKLYKITICPTSNFATSLRGDTLFGQMCWSIRFVFGEERLKLLLESYATSPFLIVSDGFATGYLPKPKMPSLLLGEDSDAKKANRKKIWLTMEQLSNGLFTQAQSDEEVKHSNKLIPTMHNSLNYKTFRTSDDGSFAPYGEKEYQFTDQDIFLLIDEEQITLDEIKQTFALLSESGYGKNTTIGKGRFEMGDFEDVDIDNTSKTYMTLSPFSPKGTICKALYYEPFTRFGKFGGERAFKNAFKKPILLADTASVIDYEDEQAKQYIGSAIKNISNVHQDAVHQGYSIVVPIKDLS